MLLNQTPLVKLAFFSSQMSQQARREFFPSLYFTTYTNTTKRWRNCDGRGRLDLHRTFQEYFFNTSSVDAKQTKATKLQIARFKSNFVVMFLMQFVIPNFSKNLFWHLQKMKNLVHCVGCRCSERWREHVTGAEQRQKLFSLCSASCGSVV